ncbi:MAG: hypothetical protein GY757_57545 [bacterium]|nr:hypothetical protein [bacterium]
MKRITGLFDTITINGGIVCFLAAIFLLTPLFINAEVVPFDSPQWVIDKENGHIEEYMGKKSLFLKKGIVYIKDAAFTDGIIEFDMVFSNKRGFSGAVFRMQDLENFEKFYLRAHQSGNPDALQYTPVFNGMSGWQLYSGDGFSAKHTHQFDRWFHVKLVVSGKKAELYIGDGKEPVLVMNELKMKPKPGAVGLKVNLAPAHFSNFSYTKIENPVFMSKAKPSPAIEKGTVMSWMISDAFDGNEIKGKVSHDAHQGIQELSWHKLACETSGLANIARVSKITRIKNTAYAKIIIESGKQQIKEFSFGFSDAVKVYLNNRLLYAGSDVFRSRDYRFLGTIGYFDRLYLPLEKGKNELIIAVSESFGGWGIKARFPGIDESITIK